MGQLFSAPSRPSAPDAPANPHGKKHLFIELEERWGERWEERGRWNHALEEDIVDAAGRQSWSQPHLPTISVPAIVKLRQVLTAENVRCAHTFEALLNKPKAVRKRNRC